MQSKKVTFSVSKPVRHMGE